jgi:hypothetical protein
MSESSSEDFPTGPSPDDKKLNPEAFFEEALELQLVTRTAAYVAMDLRAAGPLYQYAIERRDDAVRSLQALVEIDPKATIEIAAAQTSVREYLNIVSFIRQKLHDGAMADNIIKDTWGERDDGPSEYAGD